jgi:hypothetical protein
MMTHGGVGEPQTVFLFSALCAGEWLASCLGHLTAGEYLKIYITNTVTILIPEWFTCSLVLF